LIGNYQPALRRVLSSVAVLAVILAFSLLAQHPPHGKPTTAPATEFSAARALGALHRILPDDTPHPLGSAANDAVRVRILAELTRLAYQPVVHTDFDCSSSGVCATVNNILARLDGTAPGEAVLLSAHYDSVPAGPGDSDDGVGVASVLEIARALKALPAPRHSIILLIDDGEEDGLLGARAFVDCDSWAKPVRADVNLDDRGTSGPSLMFETGSANEWALRLYARHAARHLTGSIFYTVYKLLPNDTDFTVFKQAGYQGLNFAFVGNVALYHTPLDNSANVSVASLQDQGANGLASIVALADANLSPGSDASAVYFDLFGRPVVRWPGRWTLALAFAAALLLAGQIAWLMYKRRLALHELLWGLIGWLAIFVAAGVAGLVLRGILALAGAAPVQWVAHPLPAEIAFALLAIAIAIASGSLVARTAGFWGLWSGAWIWGALLSIVIGATSPGVSYVLLVPTIVAVLGALPAAFEPRELGWTRDVALLLPLVASAIVLMPLSLLLYSALGNQALVAIAVTAVLMVTPLIPLCAELRQLPGFGGLALRWSPILAVGLAAFAAAVVPAYSAKSPERVNFDYALDADSGMARWIVYPGSGRLQAPIQLAGAFQRTVHGAFPWDTHASFIADAPHLDLSAPTFTILESSLAGDRRSFTALLRSERGAPDAAVMFPPGANVESVRIEGQPVEPETSRVQQYFNGWIAYSCPSMPAAGINITFTLPVGKMVEVTAIDRSYGLPSVGAFLANARPLTATPSQDGDLTIVSRRVQLFP
jgi:Peptidase family M28